MSPFCLSSRPQRVSAESRDLNTVGANQLRPRIALRASGVTMKQ